VKWSGENKKRGRDALFQKQRVPSPFCIGHTNSRCGRVPSKLPAYPFHTGLLFPDNHSQALSPRVNPAGRVRRPRSARVIAANRCDVVGCVACTALRAAFVRHGNLGRERRESNAGSEKFTANPQDRLACPTTVRLFGLCLDCRVFVQCRFSGRRIVTERTIPSPEGGCRPSRNQPRWA
jgi:hypothetical protein